MQSIGQAAFNGTLQKQEGPAVFAAVGVVVEKVACEFSLRGRISGCGIVLELLQGGQCFFARQRTPTDNASEKIKHITFLTGRGRNGEAVVRTLGHERGSVFGGIRLRRKRFDDRRVRAFRDADDDAGGFREEGIDIGQRKAEL